MKAVWISFLGPSTSFEIFTPFFFSVSNVCHIQVVYFSNALRNVLRNYWWCYCRYHSVFFDGCQFLFRHEVYSLCFCTTPVTLFKTNACQLPCTPPNSYPSVQVLRAERRKLGLWEDVSHGRLACLQVKLVSVDHHYVFIGRFCQAPGISSLLV